MIPSLPEKGTLILVNYRTHRGTIWKRRGAIHSVGFRNLCLEDQKGFRFHIPLRSILTVHAMDGYGRPVNPEQEVKKE